MIPSSSINLSKIIPYKEKTYMEFTYINYSKQCDIKQYFGCERYLLQPKVPHDIIFFDGIRDNLS